MDDRYQTEAERIRRHLREDLTTKERLKNWWWYHRVHVWIGCAVLLVAVYLVWQTAGQSKPDYHVAYVGAAFLSEEDALALEECLAALGEDVNGDGRVVVQLHQYCLPLGAETASELAYEVIQSAQAGLEADFNVDQSGIFLLTQPQAFETQYNALSRIDGSLPQNGGEEWEDTVVALEDLPALRDLSLPTGLYVGFRGTWDEQEEQKLSPDRELWNRVLQGIQ